MKLLFKQRLFSWFDSYDIYTQDGGVAYTVCGKLAWGHKLEIHDPDTMHVATLRQQVMTLLPRFDILIGGEPVGTITKEFTLFKPSFSISCNGWRVDGNFLEWDYQILDANNRVVANIEKQLFNFTDTYSIDVDDPRDSLLALMVVLAIDAVKC